MSLEIQDISVRIARRWVLSGLSFSVEEPGALVMLTGDNGAGKSTLLRVIASVLRPQRGKVAWKNLEASSDWLYRRRVGWLPHEGLHYGELSARQNLDIVLATAGASKADGDSLLERVRLDAHAHRPVEGFSAGMRRRLGLAKLLAWKPELALLDEPRAQLDQEGMNLIDQVVEELRAQGTTVVMATHEPEYWQEAASYHVHLRGGRLSSFNALGSSEVAS
jgi:heme exporter protein A